MKRTVAFFILVITFAFCFACATGEKGKPAFYLSPVGNDAWSGKLPEPDKNGTDGPFATLERARDAVRELKKAGKLPQEGMTVYLRNGYYPLMKTFTLTTEDSGTETAPVIWRSYESETAHIIGGKVVTGFDKAKSPDELKRIRPEFADSIFKTDLKAQGITVYGDLKRTGMGMPIEPAPLELFFDGKPMTLARYPNNEWLTIADVPQKGGKLVDAYAKHCGRFIVKDDRLKSWVGVEDIWMHGYWGLDWADQYLKVVKFDPKTGEVYPDEPYHHYGFAKGQRFYFRNILEELDSPGEYYLDRSNGVLYFWPPLPIDKREAFVSMLDQVMLSLDEVTDVTIKGIVFEGTRADAISIKGGARCVIAGCTIRNIGNNAVTLTGGVKNGVRSCDIYDIGDNGVILGGGDRKTLTPAGNFVDNCDIHRYSRINRTYRPAINLSGVGNTIAHTFIHDAPHAGVLYEGNEHVIEYCEFTKIAQETGDVGAIYTCMDWTYRGNSFRYNFFHHIHGPGKLGCMTIYQDLPGSGAHIYGNILWDLDWGFFTNSGRDNIIENNIFVKCNPSVGYNIWRQPWMFQEGGDKGWRIWERLQEVNYKEPPYSTKYPELLRIFADGDPAIPTGNVITRNISCGGTFFQFRDPGLNFEILSIKDNLIADPVILDWYQGKGKIDSYKFGDKKIMDEYAKYGNVVIDGDPGFVDIEHGNFNLKKDSPALKLGFKPIPFDQMGLIVDEYRTTVPSR